nr:hypothetical protein [Tanacetum cinerariifolium]
MRRASKGYTGVDIPLFLTMLVQGPILQGEGSIVPVESHHTPSGAPTTSQSPLLLPSRIPTRQETEVPQPSSPTHTHLADEAASTGVDVRHGGAATIVTSLDVGQGSGNIDKTPSMPHDLPLSRVNTLGSDEGSMTLHELTVLCTTLSQKMESLEVDLKQTKQVYGAAYTKLIMKGRSMIKEIDQDAKVTLVTPTKNRSERVPTPSYDSPLLGVHTPGSDEKKIKQHELVGNVQQQTNDPPLSRGHTLGSGEDSIKVIKELMETSTKLSERVLALEELKTAQDLVVTRLKLRSNDLPLSRGHTLGSGEDSIKLIKKLMKTYTKLSERVLALEESQTAQDLVITRLKLRVKKLARNPQPMKRRLFKVRVESSAEENLDEEDPSKQGRGMIEEINQDVGVTLVQIDVDDQGRFNNKVITQGEVQSQPGDQLGVFSTTKLVADATKVHTYTRRRRAVNSGSDGISTASRIASTAKESVSIDEERDKYSEVDQAKMLLDLINQRKKYFAAKRAEEKRKKPMTQAQQRTYMPDYIKHMGSYTFKQLKKLSFDEIKELFEATMRSINDFVPMESKDDKAVPKLAEARSSKRDAEEELEHEGSKKQKTSKASGSTQE